MSGSSVRRTDRWMEQHGYATVSAARAMGGPSFLAGPLLYLDPRAYFDERARRWVEETAPLSSPSERAEHPACREIVAMGHRALPLVLGAFEEHPWRWVLVLQEMAGVQPVPEASFGDVEQVKRAWQGWARSNGVSP